MDRQVRKKVAIYLVFTSLTLLSALFFHRLMKTSGQIQVNDSSVEDENFPDPSSTTRGTCMMVATNVSMRVSRKDCKNGFQTIAHAIRQDSVGWYKRDAWKNDFFISCSDPDQVIVISNGPDQVPNTPDDVVCSVPWSFKLLTWMQFLRLTINKPF